jgi:anaerobic carbon-monoxide dehydrogenase iron sulfur subunit
MKRVYTLEKLCLNCRLCEVQCKTQHSKSKDIIKAWLHEDPIPQSRIHVEGTNMFSVAVQCRHCDTPACVTACISGAMAKDLETGLVTCDTEKCIGCMTCVIACPFGSILVDGVALKCDLCSEADVSDGKTPPVCVAACPNQALVYVESEASHE